MGFFHADPHPGNLVATNSGALVYFDFGMMGEIPRHYRVGLIQVVRAVELFLTQGTRSNYCQAKDVLQNRVFKYAYMAFCQCKGMPASNDILFRNENLTVQLYGRFGKR